MAMASGIYGITLRDILDASQLAVDLVSDTIKGALVTDSYTPDFNAHDFYADITNEVANGNGYTTGGVTLSGLTLGISSGILTWDANDLQWTEATFTARGLVTWDDSVTGDPLIHAVTFGSDVEVVAGTLDVTVNASGLITSAYSPS